MAGSAVLLRSLGNGVIVDGNGVPQNGHNVFIYVTATTTQINVYSDAALSIPLSQPLVTGQGSGVPNGAIPGYVAGEQAVDFYDSTAGIRVQANPVSSADLGTAGIGSAGLPASVETTSSALAVINPIEVVNTASVDLCRPSYNCTVATQLTVTLNGTTTATVTAGSPPASGAIIGTGIAAGTTFTASGSTLTLSSAATASGSETLWAGMDITTELQAAVTAVSAYGYGGEVYFSVPGIYLVNGAPQSGSVVSTVMTSTLNGAQTLPLGTITVASTANYDNWGTMSVGGQIVTYTGTTATTLTGCVGGSGLIANGATVAQVFPYDGQILFPAVNFETAANLAVKIRGAVAPTSGIASTGLANGTVLLSSAASGFVFDMIPDQEAYGAWCWTGIMPIYENLIVRLPSNPQCGGISALNALRARLERVQVDAVGATTAPGALTGTLEGIVLPHLDNNGDVTLRDVSVRNVAYGIRLSEHGVSQGNLELIGMLAAFTFNRGTHLNNLGYFDVEDCNEVFHCLTTSTSNPAGVKIVGNLDSQPASGLPILLYDTNTAGSGTNLQGSIGQSLDAGGSLPLGGGSGGVLAQLDVTNVGEGSGRSWQSRHPYDDFLRRPTSITAAQGAPGQMHPGLTPWRVVAGGFNITTNSMKATGSSQACYPVLDAQSNGKGRSITLNLTTQASGYGIGLIANRRFNSGVCLAARLSGVDVILDVGSWQAGTLTVAAGVAGSTTYALRMELYYQNGSPWIVRVMLNGVPYITYVLSAAQISSIAASTSAPYLEDGVGTTAGDAGSSFNSIIEEDLGGTIPAYTFSTSAARTALVNETTVITANSPTITLPQPAQGIPNTIVNVGTGTGTITPPSGTLMNLSGATGNITLAQGAKAVIESLDGSNFQQVG